MGEGVRGRDNLSKFLGWNNGYNSFVLCEYITVFTIHSNWVHLIRTKYKFKCIDKSESREREN